MKTDVLPAAVIPVKYAFGKNVRISSVPGRSGRVNVLLDITTAFVFAAAELTPYPRYTIVTVELAGTMMRYWFDPNPLETA
jgi:hypothetical protein